MPRKTTTSSDSLPPPRDFPSHDKLRALLQRELEIWEHHKGPYPLPVLTFLINEIEMQLGLAEETDGLEKDTAFYAPASYVHGITNGELFYSLSRTLARMMEDPSFQFAELREADQQVFASTLSLGSTLFLDYFKESGDVAPAVDLWILYEWVQNKDGRIVWSGDDEQPIDPPPLRQLTVTDWETIADFVMEHFVPDGEVDYTDLALLDEQPHWPSFQEFRQAKAYLRHWSQVTRGNRRAEC